MSSFFSNGFATILSNRRRKTGKNKDDGKCLEKQDKKDEGRWDMLTDAYGRQYWQHSVTGEWSYVYGAGLVSPVGTVNPSPLPYPGGAAFTPSPVYPVAPAKKREKRKGWWETMYDDDGNRYWEHTVTKKKTYNDPYF